MISPTDTTPGISLAVIPYWNPSRNPLRRRFDVIIKVARGVTLEDTTVMLRLRDEAGRATSLPSLLRGVPRMIGPSWRRLNGEYVTSEDVHSVEAAIPGVVQSPTIRREHGAPAIELGAVNTVPFWDVLSNHKLWLDGVP